MAKPYKEGRGWSMRERFKGQDLYESGHATAAKAKKAVRDRISAIEKRGQPVGFGPTRTTLAQALSDYALEMLPNMKGASQEAQRINNYLRAAGLPTLIVTPKTGDEHPEENVGRFSKVTLSLSEGEVRPVVASLAAHRAKLSTRTAKSDALRRQLARTRVSEITRDQVQEFLSTSSADGLSAATVSLERSLLRVFFNRARTRWNWAAPSENPATDLVLAPINNDRDRVLSAVEEEALFEAMADCGNAFIPLATRLLLETAMRCSDLLHYAKWGQVDSESCMLHLNRTDVPLHSWFRRPDSYRLLPASKCSQLPEYLWPFSRTALRLSLRAHPCALTVLRQAQWSAQKALRCVLLRDLQTLDGLSRAGSLLHGPAQALRPPQSSLPAGTLAALRSPAAESPVQIGASDQPSISGWLQPVAWLPQAGHSCGWLLAH